MSQKPPRKRRRHVTPDGKPSAAVLIALPSPPGQGNSRTLMKGNARIQVPATAEQKEILEQAATRAGYGNARTTGGMGAYIASRILPIAESELADAPSLTIPHQTAARARDLAAAEGISPEQVLARGLDLLQAIRTSNAAVGH